jgi:hypothetical protein
MVPIGNNRAWAHREAKRRAAALNDPISIYRSGDFPELADYIIRTTAAAKPTNGFRHVATIEADGSYSFGSEHV